MIGDSKWNSGTLVKLITENDEDYYINELGDDVRYAELFGTIREQFHSHQKKQIVLFKLTGLTEKEEQSLFIEDNDFLDEIVFVDEEIRTVNGKKVKYLEYEVYFLEKKQLRVFFLAEKNIQNDIYSEIIMKFANRFIVKNKSEYVPELEYIYIDHEISVEKDENDVIVVITAGRFINHVLQNINATSVLIFTMPENYSTFKKNYLNENYPQVKEVNTIIENLLRDKFFLEN
jgi:hypothetical protein